MRDFLGQVGLSISRRLLTYFLAVLSMGVGAAAYLCITSLDEGFLREQTARAERRDPMVTKPSLRVGFSTAADPRRDGPQPLVTVPVDQVVARVRGVVKGEVGVTQSYQTTAKYGRLVLSSVASVLAVSGNTYGDALEGSAQIIRGRALTSDDDRETSAVCLMPEALYDALTPAGDPLGRVVRIGAYPFRVVGVLADTDPGTPARSCLFVIPRGAGARYLSAIPPRQTMLTIGSTEEGLTGDLDRVEALMNRITRSSHSWRWRRAHLEDEGGAETKRKPDAFDLYSPWLIGADTRAQQQTVRLRLGMVASLSLTAGLLGLVSMLLANLNNRRYEIGLHRALGATRGWQAAEVLCEAGIVGLLGGVVGIGLGAGVLRLLAVTMGAQLVLTPQWAAAAVVASTLAALLAGLLPARAALRITPGEALRSL
jgi:putative ABC transport system permease protein